MASLHSRRARRRPPRAVCLAVFAVTIAVSWAVWPSAAQAFRFIRQAVGGIYIDARGAVASAEQDRLGKLREFRLKALAPVPREMGQPAELRKISLRLLDETIGECLRDEQPLPDDIKYLAGLQRIQYVFVYPEINDIVLAGYGEGWRVGPRGYVVGATTGRPVLLLDDLLVALRTARGAAQGGISCSIDPTKEGLARLQTAINNLQLGLDPSLASKKIARIGTAGGLHQRRAEL